MINAVLLCGFGNGDKAALFPIGTVAAMPRHVSTATTVAAMYISKLGCHTIHVSMHCTHSAAALYIC